MKRILFLCFLLIASSVWAWTGIGFMGGGSPPSSDDYSDITFWWRCEAADFSGTNGTLDYSAGDVIANLNSAAAINTDAVKYNTNGLDCPGANDRAELTVSSDDIIDADEFRIGFWYNRTTYADYSIIIQIFQDVNNKSNLGIYSTDGIYWEWKDGGTSRTALSIADAGLDATTWYFIEFACKVSTNYREVFVDGVSKGSSAETIGTFAPNLFSFGIISAVASDFYFDEIKISDDSTRDFNALKDVTSYPG